jgi:nickel-type superoxide dismutase maturation protease
MQIFNWLLGRIQRFRVAGLSMEPALVAGQTVLVDFSAFEKTGPAVGQIVLVRLPSTDSPCIKRVAANTPRGLDLRGDNPQHSTDSRQLGPVSAEEVLGHVICSFP